MTGATGLLLGIALPVAAAAFALSRWVPRGTPGRWTLVWGYALVLGTFSPALVLWAIGKAGLPLTFVPTLLVAVAAWVAAARPWRRVAGLEPRPSGWREGLAGMSMSARVAVPAFVLLLAAHAVLIGTEVFLRPVYPWDAWAQWTTKAKVWFHAGSLVPFVTPAEWLAASPGSVATDAAPHYLPLVPLAQTWIALSLGAWSERLIGLPWALWWLGLVLAVYGQARAWPLPAAWSAFIAYAIGSLPMLDVHAALAGYADLPQAVIFTLAALALVAWARRREGWQLAMGLVAAAICPLVKQPGVAWLATLGVVPLFALLPRRAPALLGIAAAVLVLAGTAMTTLQPVIFGYRVDMKVEPRWWPLFENTFLMGNWGLLFYALAAAIVLGWREALAPPLRALTALVATGAALLLAGLSVTSARDWVEDYSTVNRAILHWAPLAGFWCLVVLASLRLPSRLAERIDPLPDPRTADVDVGRPAR